jgi:hypothetical protein
LKGEEILIYLAAKADALKLPVDQRAQFLEAHKARFERFLRSNPGNGSLTNDHLSQTTSSTTTSTTTEFSVVVGPSAGWRRFVGKLRPHKRKWIEHQAEIKAYTLEGRSQTLTVRRAGGWKVLQID